MNKYWVNIFKQIRTAAKAAVLPWLSVAFLLTSAPIANAATTEPKDFCIVKEDTTPDIKTTANCKKASCETKPGCLDPAPVKPATRFSSVPGQRKQAYKDGVPVGSTGHKGNDIAAPMGATIYAAADGTITIIGHQMDAKSNSGYGNYITLEHENGVYYTVYAHMKCFARKQRADGSIRTLSMGTKVKKGEVIGFVGMTGGTSGPHLHYEIRKGTGKGAPALDATLPENQKNGPLCEIIDGFVQAGLSSDGTGNPSGGGSNCSSGGGGVSDGNCAKMYSADDLADLHHKYESGGNVCAFNKCAVKDKGGCSYGSSQLACTPGSMKTYLTTLQKSSPQIWSALGGGTVDQMNSRACTSPAADFSTKWASLCSSGMAGDLSQTQSKYMEPTYLTPSLNHLKKSYGMDLTQRPAELQMAVFSAAVQFGSVNEIFRHIKANIGDPAKMNDEDLIKAMYQARDVVFARKSPSLAASVSKRYVNESAEALESMKIRKAWEEEQKKTPHKTYEELVKELTGKDACEGGKSGSFNCTPGGGVAEGATGGAASSTETYSERPGKNCAPSQYSSTMKDCLFCPLFKVIFDTASLMAKLSFEKLAIPVMSVVLVAWAIWIAMMVLKFVSALDTKDAPSMIKELLGKSIVVLVVVLFLQADSSTFFQMALEPIFNTGFKLAQLAVADGACTKDFNVMKDGGLPPSMGNSILCTIQAVQDRLVNTMALGSASMCVGWYIKAKLVIFGSLAYVISGLLIWAGCLVMMIIFPFLMLDSIFQLTVSCALLPAAIGCYPFKTTNGYVKTIWNSFINAMFNFIFLSIVILILTEAIDVTLGTSVYQTLDKNNMDEGYMNVIVTALAWSGIALLKIVFVLLLGWVVLDEISGFAGQFAGGISTGGIGRQVGGMAASGAQKLGGKAWSSAKTVGGAVGENIKEAAGDWNRERKMNNITRNGTAENIVDKDNNVIGQKFVSKNKSWFRGREKTNEVTVKGSMKDGVFVADKGTKMLVTSKDYGNGKIVTTKSDGFLKQTETSVNGVATGGEITITSAGLKSIRNRDGTMNTTALDAAIRGSAFDEKIVRAAAMQEYAKQSFPDVSDGLRNISGVGKFNGSLDNADITLVQNEKGQQVLQVTEKGEDGSSKVMRMTMGESGRPLLEVESTASNGQFLSRSTDGMFNKVTEGSVDMKTGEKSNMRSQYSASEYYAKRNQYLVSESGDLSSDFRGETQTAFSDADVAKMKLQFVQDRRRGEQNKIAGIL